MRRGRYQREVVERLARIEGNLDKICKELARTAARHDREPEVQSFGEPDKWLQEGMNNIMAFQAGQKRGDAK